MQHGRQTRRALAKAQVLEFLANGGRGEFARYLCYCAGAKSKAVRQFLGAVAQWDSSMKRVFRGEMLKENDDCDLAKGRENRELAHHSF